MLKITILKGQKAIAYIYVIHIHLYVIRHIEELCRPHLPNRSVLRYEFLVDLVRFSNNIGTRRRLDFANREYLKQRKSFRLGSSSIVFNPPYANTCCRVPADFIPWRCPTSNARRETHAVSANSHRGSTTSRNTQRCRCPTETVKGNIRPLGIIPISDTQSETAGAHTERRDFFNHSPSARLSSIVTVR